VEGCEFSHIGAGGVYLNGADSAIRNNTVAHTGIMYPAAISVYFNGQRDHVTHNDIHDTSYSGIAAAGLGHRIETNRISRVMNTLNDGAAVYTTSCQGAIIRGNVAVEIGGGSGKRHAYYLDEQSVNCLVAGNVAIDAPSFVQGHMSRHNTLRENICVVHGDATMSFARSQDYSLERNILYATGAIRLVGVEAVARLAQNILYSAEGWVEGVHLVDYTETDDLVTFTSDDKTCLQDPLFVDVVRGDLRLQPDSPAHALGIPLLDVSKAGRLRS
jgi:hypothetical protein